MKHKFIYRGFCFEADKGAGSGGENPPVTSPATPTTPPAGAQKADTSGDSKMVSLERFNEVNNRLKKLEVEATTKQQKEQEAEQNRLKEQQKWQELATTHENELGQLKPQLETISQQAERYKAAVEAHLQAQLATVPEHLQTLLAKLDPVEQLEWIAANGDKLKPSAQGVPATPRPTGAAAPDAEKLQQQQRNIVQRSF